MEFGGQYMLDFRKLLPLTNQITQGYSFLQRLIQKKARQQIQAVV